ncbi:hypothetical protein ACH36K_10840 [Clostridium sp. MB05]|uniref:hypothetical protein n=1 Tax=Clostridium sp. MB05 TaxID=3376682 RepID=UPI0039829488
MVGNFAEEQDIFKVSNLDYIGELILNCSYTENNLLVNDCDEDYLMSILENILSNLMFNKKQVLIISNNYIDKIKKIDLINNLGTEVIDLVEENIKHSLKEEILNLPESTGKTAINKVELLSRSIDRKINDLLSIIRFFSIEKENSLSMVEKYSITNKKLDKYDPIFKYYKIYRIKKPLENYSYNEISDSANRILNSDVVRKYIKYRRFIDNNIFKTLNNSTDYNKLSLAIYKIDELIKDNVFKVPFIYSQYTEDFIETFLGNPSMNDMDISNLVNIVNFKYNCNLLSHKKQRGILSIFNKKRNNTIYEKNLNEFLNIKEEITKEYSDNFKILKLYIENINFLKDILNNETYEEILSKLIQGDNIESQLILYRKIINISYNIKNTISYINTIRKIDRDILDYCYANIEDKKELNDIILSIPKLKLYLEIEDEETTNLDILDKYKDFDKLIHDIEEDLITKNNLILNSINCVWNNILREKLHVSINTIEKIDFTNKELYKNLFPCVITNLDNLNLFKEDINTLGFDKIILLDDLTNSYVNNLIDLHKFDNNLIILSKSKIIGLNSLGFNNFDIVETKKSLVNRDYRNNPIVNYIYKYLERLGYLVEYNVSIDIFRIPLVVKDRKLNILVLIEIDGEIIGGSSSCSLKDIYLNGYLRSKNIKLYRIWSRDWWLDKSKELTNLVSYLDKIVAIH